MKTQMNTTSTEPTAGVEPASAAGVVILILCILTIIGNALLISSIWKLKRTNRSFHPVLITIGLFSCLELSFAIISEFIFSVSFLSEKWELESSRGLCNFTGWFAFTTKTTCAFITTILVFERYAVMCKPNSGKFGRIIESQVYWAFRAIFVAGVMATVPLFYGAGLTATSGSLCHINYASKSNASFGYTVFLLICAYVLLQLVLFCLISILCQQLNNDQHESEVPEESPVQNSNRRYYTVPPVNKRSGTPLSPSKYALDDLSYFEKMQDEERLQESCITKTILVLASWYWICTLPYLIVMTLSLSSLTISWKADFSAAILILINGAISPYLIIGLYPPCQRQILILLRQNKRLEPPVASSNQAPHSMSIVYDGMSPDVESMNARSSRSSSTWQPNTSFTTESTVVLADCQISATRNEQLIFQTDDSHNPIETADDQRLVHGGKQQRVNHVGEGQNGEALYYDNPGFSADDDNRRIPLNEGCSLSDETATSYTGNDRDSSESECSACDMMDEYPRVVFLDKLDHYYYPSRMPIYSNDQMGQLVYQQDPQNPHILYALSPPPPISQDNHASRILGRAELRKMTKKGKAPPSYLTREDIPCETSLYSHNYRAPSFLKQFQGKAGWKEHFEMERRASRYAPALEGDMGSINGALDEFDIERRNTWNGARFRSSQAEMCIRQGVDRHASYRLAVGDDDFIDTGPEISDSDTIDQRGMQPSAVVEKDMVLRDVTIENPLAMNMAFQKVILQGSGGSMNSTRDSGSDYSGNASHKHGTPGAENHQHNEPIDKKYRIDHAISASLSGQDSPTLPREQPSNNDLPLGDSMLIIEDQYSKRNTSDEPVEQSAEVHEDVDSISLASVRSNVSYRQYVRTITAVTPQKSNDSEVPTIEISPPNHSVDTDSDSDRSVESLLYMFSNGIGKLAVPSTQKAKQTIMSGTEFSTSGAEIHAQITNNTQNEGDITESSGNDNNLAKDNDHAAFYCGIESFPDVDDDAFGNLDFDIDTDLGFADDLTAEFDRKLGKRLAAASIGSQTSEESDTRSQTSSDQIIAEQIRLIVENIVQDEENNLMNNRDTEPKDVSSTSDVEQATKDDIDADYDTLCNVSSETIQRIDNNDTQIPKVMIELQNTSTLNDAITECPDEGVDAVNCQEDDRTSTERLETTITHTDENNANNNNHVQVEEQAHFEPSAAELETSQINSYDSTNQVSMDEHPSEINNVVPANVLPTHAGNETSSSYTLAKIADVELPELPETSVDNDRLDQSSILVDDVFESDHESHSTETKGNLDACDIPYVVRYNRMRTPSASSTDNVAVPQQDACHPHSKDNAEQPLKLMEENERLPNVLEPETDHNHACPENAHICRHSDNITTTEAARIPNDGTLLVTTSPLDSDKSQYQLHDDSEEQVAFPSPNTEKGSTSSTVSSSSVNDYLQPSPRDNVEYQESALHLSLSESFKQQLPPPSPYVDSPLPPPSPYDDQSRPEPLLQSNTIKTPAFAPLPDCDKESHESLETDHLNEHGPIDETKPIDMTECNVQDVCTTNPSDRVENRSNGNCEGSGMSIEDIFSERSIQSLNDVVPSASSVKIHDDKQMSSKQKSPKRNLWKRYKHAMLKMANENTDNDSMLENGSQGDGNDQERCTDLKLTESMRQMITDLGENSQSGNDQKSIVLPGVAPRKQNPRTLWKKYRRDVITLSKEIKDGGKTNIDLKPCQTAAPSESNEDQFSIKERSENRSTEVDPNLVIDIPKFMHHESSSIADTPKETRVELPQFMRHESSSIAETPKTNKHPLLPEQNVSGEERLENDVKPRDTEPQKQANESDIWETIERRSSDDVILNTETPQDHQLFQKMLESSHSLTPAMERTNAPQEVNDSGNVEGQNGDSIHVNLHSVPALLDGVMGEDVVVLEANSMTSVPMNTNIPSPDGTPTHINVVNMLMIDTNDGHQTFVNVNEEASPESSFSSSDLSSLSRSSEHSQTNIENIISGPSARKLALRKNLKRSEHRRHSTGTLLPPRNECDDLDMSVCSGETGDLSVCSGDSDTLMMAVGRRRCASVSGCAALDRQGSFLDHSELI